MLSIKEEPFLQWVEVQYCLIAVTYVSFKYLIQYNLNGSNTDGSFIVDDSNSVFSPHKILSVAQENKYLMIFSYFIMELYAVCTH